MAFNKASFTRAEAKSWAKDHGFSAGKVDSQKNYWRIRQLDPRDMKSAHFRWGSKDPEEMAKWPDGVVPIFAEPKAGVVVPSRMRVARKNPSGKYPYALSLVRTDQGYCLAHRGKIVALQNQPEVFDTFNEARKAVKRAGWVLGKKTPDGHWPILPLGKALPAKSLVVARKNPSVAVQLSPSESRDAAASLRGKKGDPRGFGTLLSVGQKVQHRSSPWFVFEVQKEPGRRGGVEVTLLSLDKKLMLYQVPPEEVNSGKEIRNNPEDANDMDDEVLEGMARALYVSDWASRMEEQGQSFSGMELMDVAPETTDAAKNAAAMLAGAIVEKNKKTLTQLLNAALKADNGEDSEDYFDYANDFGHYLGMMGLGHGVSWFDSHEKFPLKVPDIEAYDLEDD